MRTFVAIEISDQGVLNSITQVQDELNIKAKPVEVHNMHFHCTVFRRNVGGDGKKDF